DIDLVALLQVLLGDVRQPGSLVVPADDPVPLGLFLLLPPLPRPLPAGGQRQRRHPAPVGGAPHLGIGPQIADQLHFVETPAHNDLPAKGGSGAQGCPTVYDPQVILSIKDTPLVPMLRITCFCGNGSAEKDRILDRLPIVTRPAADLPEPQLDRKSTRLNSSH